MYKKTLQIIRKRNKQVSYFLSDLHKSIGNKPNAILNKQPHFIFSAENTPHPRKTSMDHESVMQLLRDKGYKADEMYHVDEIKGKYGNEEKSILVHNPPRHSIKHFHQLAHSLGQESSIYSDGYNHEMHFHHGENAGQHIKGQGTNFPKQKPDDFYSTTSDGSHFQHNFNWDSLHPQKESMLKMKPAKIGKSEFFQQNGFYLCKNEDNHPLDNQNPDTKLIHYSPHRGLTEMDPEYHGIRGIGSEAKQGKPVHPMSFFYLEGTEPESVVTTGAKSKYVTSLGDKKLYDIGKDKHGLWNKAKEIADKRQINPGIVQKEDFHSAIRDAGYHGIYNSSLNNTMKNVVGMFEKMPMEKEYPMHPRDFKEATAFDHHSHKDRYDGAKQFADETGHHDHKFLAKLKSKTNNKVM